MRNWRFAILLLAVAVWLLGSRAAAQRAARANDSFQFVILGDRTGETEPAVYERVWQEAAAEDPSFVLSVGDSIQGLNDATRGSRMAAIRANPGTLPALLALSHARKS